MSGTALVAIAAPARKVLCAEQGEIRIEFDEDGNALIIQKNWPEEDSTIRVSRDNLQTFLNGVCDAFGVSSFGGS